jgi:hypothetical protein
MPTLNLRNGAAVVLTATQGGQYYRLGAHQHAYLFDNAEIGKVGQSWRLVNDEYDGQVTRYLANNLTLVRGLPRQHPLFYEVSRMGVLAPLGIGEMPDWSTNQTRYIPFGPDLPAAQGVAMGRAGMGPGDDLRMIADFATVRAGQGNVTVGLTIQVTIGPGTGVAFFNSGEIQIRGPLHTGLTTANVELPVGDLPAAAAPAESTRYEQTHSRLRHARTVAAIAAHTDARLTAVRGVVLDRQTHADALMQMRTAVVETTRDPIRDLLTTARRQNRPGTRDDVNFRAYLDSSLNREAHDGYVAAIVSGRDAPAARTAGQQAAMGWMTQVVNAFAAYNQQEVALFPAGWDA